MKPIHENGRPGSVQLAAPEPGRAGAAAAEQGTAKAAPGAASTPDPVGVVGWMSGNAVAGSAAEPREPARPARTAAAPDPARAVGSIPAGAAQSADVGGKLAGPAWTAAVPGLVQEKAALAGGAAQARTAALAAAGDGVLRGPPAESVVAGMEEPLAALRELIGAHQRFVGG